MRTALAVLLLCAAVPSAEAQTQTQRRFVRAVGTATVSGEPDEARVSVGVTTQALTAQEASQQNATQVNAVLAALRGLLGARADLKTVNYSLSPVYRYPQGQPPVLTGYNASNTVEVRTDNLNIVGQIIDTATAAGANTVTSLRFGIKEDQPLRAQALRRAATEARAQATAMAEGLNVRLGNVLMAEEGTSVRPPVPFMESRVAAAAPTPIETGLVQVQATVTLEIEII